MIAKTIQVDNVFIVVWHDEVTPEDIARIFEETSKQAARAKHPLVYVAYCGTSFRTPATSGPARDAVFETLPKVLEHCGTVNVVYDHRGGWIAELQYQGLRAMMALARLRRVPGVERVYAEDSVESVLYRERENLDRGLVTYADVLKALRGEGIVN
ncbi:MAG: hypothetical protein HC882_00915 [Acidobacteria bacterium]|nr:hypothetical protein [Acidobacteriota bacterium]